MRDPDCLRAMKALHLGLPYSAREHVAGCATCRREAESLSYLFDELAAGAKVRVPRRVGAPVLHALRLASGGPRFAIRAVPALLLAVLGLASFVSLVTCVLAQTPVADVAPLAAVILVGGYLAVCAAASMPLLLRVSKRRAPIVGELNP